ncbi:MAG: hypothetical protein JSW10_10925 [Pseudomonadota bacterium]|nr:MAG: hypothetical protein JSW10_10925 [Pseudomonadota bacterium]
MMAGRILLTVLALGAMAVSTAQAHSWLAECNIGFDNEFALRWNYAQARGTFAQHTGLSESGDAEVCDPDTHIACWTYRQRCGSRGYVNVQEAPLGKYNHFHLMFEDPSLTCFADNGDGLGAGYGRDTGGGCVAADWKNEPRFAAGHEPKHFMRLWVEDRVTHQPRMFDVASIRIRGPADGEVWFRKLDGSWWYWPRLGPGRWNLSAWTWEITDLYVRASNGEGTSVSFDDVVVRN